LFLHFRSIQIVLCGAGDVQEPAVSHPERFSQPATEELSQVGEGTVEKDLFGKNLAAFFGTTNGVDLRAILAKE
jgi:hypothetical protein